jgi:hypothetical protein
MRLQEKSWGQIMEVYSSFTVPKIIIASYLMNVPIFFYGFTVITK